MERKLGAIITIIVLVLTIAIYYYTNNLSGYSFVFKSFVIFFIGYCSLYIVWLYKDFLDNSKLIYRTGGSLEDKEVLIAKNEIPAFGPYFSDLGIVILDKQKRILFKKNSINKYGLPLLNVDNTFNPFEKIKNLFKEYVGKELDLNDIISQHTYTVHRKDLSRYVKYHIYYMNYDIEKPSEGKCSMMSLNDIYSEFRAETSKGLFSQGTQFDLDKMIDDKAI